MVTVQFGFGFGFVTSKHHTPRDPEESSPQMDQVIGIETLVPILDSEIVFEPALACFSCSVEAPKGKSMKFDQIIDSSLKWLCNSSPLPQTMLSFCVKQACWHRHKTGYISVCAPRNPERALYTAPAPEIVPERK